MFASLAGAVTLGCATAATPPPGHGAPPSPPPRETLATPVAAPRALAQHMRRLGFLPLALLLPDSEGWATARDEARVYEAAHSASASRLTAEALDGSFGTSVQCAHTSPRGDSDARTRIDEGTVRAPLSLEVAFAAHADERADRVVTGDLLAFTVVGGRCTRLRLETRARGEDAAAEVGARLAFFRDVSLPSLLVVRDGHGPAPARTSLERR